MRDAQVTLRMAGRREGDDDGRVADGSMLSGEKRLKLILYLYQTKLNL